MPFDPKLLPSDEPPLKRDGELDLPADLEALGEQLRDDAAHLARQFPPSPAAAPLRVRSRSPRKWNWQLAGAAGVAGAMIATAAVFVLTTPFTATQTRGKSAVTRNNSAVVGRAPIVGSAEGPSRVRHDDSSEYTISLADLSSPELEALLDLMERQPDAVGSVSF
jgi:hypothetical protein